MFMIIETWQKSAGEGYTNFLDECRFLRFRNQEEFFQYAKKKALEVAKEEGEIFEEEDKVSEEEKEVSEKVRKEIEECVPYRGEQNPGEEENRFGTETEKTADVWMMNEDGWDGYVWFQPTKIENPD